MSCPSNKCLMCSKTRAKGSMFCRYHSKLVEPPKKLPSIYTQAFKFAKYQGNIVAFLPQEDGSFRPSYVGMNASKVPKSKLIDLDTYCPGYTRQQVKKIKNCILAMTSA